MNYTGWKFDAIVGVMTVAIAAVLMWLLYQQPIVFDAQKVTQGFVIGGTAALLARRIAREVRIPI